MGSDKALLEIRGVPLWRRQREVLAAAGVAQIFLSARDDQPWARAASDRFVAVLPDLEKDGGPLAGIAAAMGRASHPWVVVVAVDLPRLTAEFLSDLMGFAGAGKGVVPAWADGRAEPLCAVYPSAAADIARQFLARRRLKLQEFVGALETAGFIERRLIAPDEAEYFANWNEPADGP